MDKEPENLGTAEQKIDNRTLFRRLYLIILVGAGLLLFIYFLIEPLVIAEAAKKLVWSDGTPITDGGIVGVFLLFFTVATFFLALLIGLIGCLAMMIKLLSALPDRMKKTGGSIFWNILTMGMGGGFLFLICYIALLLLVGNFLIPLVVLFMKSSGYNAEFAGDPSLLFMALFSLISLLFIGRWTGIGMLLYLNKITGKIKGTISKRKLSIIGWLTGAGYLLLLLLSRLPSILDLSILYEALEISVIFGISLFSAIAAFRSLSPENKAFLAEKLGDIE
ncbi:MAG: hypothetical protein M1269_02720 [Chloroflexi bacterium]|nr:hypothetical protein [Chloroflexota bacterium]